MNAGKSKMLVNKAVIVVIFMVLVSSGITSCKQISQNDNSSIAQAEAKTSISEIEVLDAQKAWGEGIVKIGQIYLEDGDYKAAATEHINSFYNYQDGIVLFKPTLVSEKPFRTDFQGALSYFIGGDENYPEDHGFAIKPWSGVRWEIVGTKIYGDVALAMGNYYFTPANGGDEVKVEFSFAYVKNIESKLKIVLHDSHLPYTLVGKH